MVELDAPSLDPIFHALGDRTRRRMLRELAEGERTVSQLADIGTRFVFGGQVPQRQGFACSPHMC